VSAFFLPDYYTAPVLSLVLLILAACQSWCVQVAGSRIYSPKHFFLEGVQQPKESPENPGNAVSYALLISRFQKICGWRCQTKTRLARFFGTVLRAVFINLWINYRMNLTPKIVRGCFSLDFATQTRPPCSVHCAAVMNFVQIRCHCIPDFY